MEERKPNNAEKTFFLVSSYKRGGEVQRRAVSSSSSDDHLDEAFGFDKSITMAPRFDSDSCTASDPLLDFSDIPATTLSFLDEDESEAPVPLALSQTLKAKVGKVFAEAIHPTRRQNASQLSTSESTKPVLDFKIHQARSQVNELTPIFGEDHSASINSNFASKSFLQKFPGDPYPTAKFNHTDSGFYSSRRPEKARTTNRRTNRVNTQDYSIDATSMTALRKTTLQIANIPNKYTKSMLMQYIDEEFSGRYDFFYLPIDFQNMCNMGYAFINFEEVEYAKRFYLAFHRSKWPRFQSDKICEVRYAVLQGQEANIKFFENSQLIRQADIKFKPFIKHQI